MTDDQQRARELKPCPFCGGEAKHSVWSIQNYHKIECEYCDVEMDYFHHEDDAFEAWNRRAALRAAPEVPAARVAELDGLESLSLIEHVRRLAKTQGAHVRYWADAYGVQAKEPHFQGHGVVAGLLTEYADLLERLAARPPAGGEGCWLTLPWFSTPAAADA